MQQDNNNIDKKLKQLENHSLPDLSKMDEHWNDLKNSLQSETSLPKSKPANNIFSWIVAASLAGVLFFALYKFIFNPNDEIISTRNWQPVSNNNPVSDTSPSINFIPGKEASTIIGKDTLTLRPQKEKITNQAFIFKGKTTEGKEIEFIATPITDTVNKKPVLEKKKTLEGFFAEMEKESQSFIINNERDTVIIGNEGTELHISANSFYPAKNVTIRLQEFYSYKDIITNKLSTTSNGKLLVTGGMLNIRAFSGSQELLGAQKDILIKMVTDKIDDSMQLFLPQTNYFQVSPTSVFENVESDTAVFTNSINWIPAGQPQRMQRSLPFIKVLNLMDDHHSISYDKYTTASYFIANSCPLSNQEVKAELEKRYGLYYGRIKVKRIWGNRKRVFLSSNTESPVIGDSLYVPFETALKYKLISREDSLKYIRDLKFEDSLYFTRISKMEKKYNFRITNLGWINCDRFYNDYRPKVEFVVNLGDTASNYYTFLVFDKIKSIMDGYISGNKVSFTNVPEGETAKIISISIKDGKPVASMQPVQISRKVFEGLKFEEITAAQFREKAATLDKP